MWESESLCFASDYASSSSLLSSLEITHLSQSISMANATQGLDSIVEHMCPLFCGLCVYAPDQMVVNISTHTLVGQISCSLVKTSK